METSCTSWIGRLGWLHVDLILQISQKGTTFPECYIDFRTSFFVLDVAFFFGLVRLVRIGLFVLVGMGNLC